MVRCGTSSLNSVYTWVCFVLVYAFDDTTSPPPTADDAPPSYMIFLFLRCCCGRLRKEHIGLIIDAFGNEWSAVRHVKESPTNAFGQVSFSEEQQDASLGAEVGRFFYKQIVMSFLLQLIFYVNFKYFYETFTKLFLDSLYFVPFAA